MRFSWLPVVLLTLLPSCSKRGADDLEGLRSMVEVAITENKPKVIMKLLHMKGADPELIELWRGMIEGMDFSAFTQIEVLSHPYDDFNPEMDLPGQLNGRKLKWLSEPTHWIDAKLSNKDENGNGMSFNLTLAAGQVEGKWRLIGATYGEQPRKAVSMPGLTDINATVIAYDDDGRILDFVHITPGDRIQEILFNAPEDGSYINVTVVGPAIDPIITPGTEVSTNNGEMMRGNVSVYVEDDKVVGIYGNRIGQGYHMEKEQLQEVLRGIQEGRKPSERVEIIRRNKHLDNLIEDDQGNLVPPDLGEKEKRFLAEMIPALKKADMEVIDAYEHQDADDETDFNINTSFYKMIADTGFKSYRFMPFDAEHPDNKSQIMDHKGNPYRYSITPKWDLTLFLSDGTEDSDSTATLLVGEDNGVLKFPTQYED